MGNQIVVTNTKVVKMGYPLLVGNKNPTFAANHSYIQLHLQGESGNEFPILLSQHEFAQLPMVECQAFNDTKPGWLHSLKIGRTKYRYLVKVNNDGTEYLLSISSSILQSGQHRAFMNKEDIVKKSMLTDMLD